MLARHEWANSASGAVPVVLIRGGITKADFKTAAALQRLGDEGDDAWGDERDTDSLFQGGGYRRPPEAFSCIPESRKAGTESFLNHRRHSPLHPRPAATPCSKGLAAARRLIVGALTLSSLAMSACVSPWAMRCNASAR
jgi:hypothetical protein